MKKSDALEFCQRWLPAWSGNRPEELAQFYTPDAFYRDPAKPQGLRGQAEILPYFRKLLALNPDWKWDVVEVFPTESGFTLKWEAQIPTPKGLFRELGLDIVEIEGGRIKRNEVYFDRVGWMKSLG